MSFLCDRVEESLVLNVIQAVSFLCDRVEELLILHPVSDKEILAIVCKWKSKMLKIRHVHRHVLSEKNCSAHISSNETYM